MYPSIFAFIIPINRVAVDAPVKPAWVSLEQQEGGGGVLFFGGSGAVRITTADPLAQDSLADKHG